MTYRMIRTMLAAAIGVAVGATSFADTTTTTTVPTTTVTTTTTPLAGMYKAGAAGAGVPDGARQRPSKSPEQAVGVDRFRHVRVETGGDRPRTVRGLREGAEGDGRRRAALLGGERAQLSNEHVAVFGRETDVAEKDVGSRGRDRIERLRR